MTKTDDIYAALEVTVKAITAEMEKVRREQLALDQRYGGLDRARDLIYVQQGRIMNEARDAQDEEDDTIGS